jgi:hypothetical protein
LTIENLLFFFLHDKEMLLAPITVTIQVTAMNEVYKVGENKGRRGDVTKSARNKSHKGKESGDESPALHQLLRPSKGKKKKKKS